MVEIANVDPTGPSDARFRKLIEHSYSGVTLLNRELKVFYRSPAAERIIGWSCVDRPAIAVELVHPDDEPILQRLLGQVNSKPREVITSRFRVQHRSGHYIWIECTATNLLNEPDVEAIVCNFVDITRQVELETEQKTNQAFIRMVTDNLPAMIAYFAADLRCRYANKPYQDFFGNGQDVINKKKSELLSESEYKDHADHLMAVLQGERQSFERRLPGTNGATVYMHTQYLPDGAPGNVKGFYSLIYDITEIKAAQEEANRKSVQMEELLSNITDGFFVADKAQRYTYVNKRLCDIVGLNADELIGRYIWDVFPKAIGSDTYKAIQRALLEQAYVCNQDYYAPLDLWQENRIYPGAEGFSMFIQDITDRKKAEEKLQQSNGRFAMIAKTTEDGLFEWDLLTKEIWWSESHYIMFGFDPLGKVPSQDAWLAKLHPNARIRFQEIVNQVLAGTLSRWEEDVTFRRLAGDWGTLLARGFVINDTDERPVKILGSFIDVTERRAAQNQRELLHAISRPFRESSDLQITLEKISGELINFTACTAVETWLLTQDKQQLSLNGVYSDNDAPTPVKSSKLLLKGEGWAGITWKTGKMQQFRTETEILQCIPLIDHEDFVGVIIFSFSSPDPLTDHFRLLPEEFGSQLGTAIRYQQMAEQLRLLFDRAPDMIGIMGTDRYFKKVNPAMCDILQYTEAELLNLPLDILIHPDDLLESRERTKAFIEGGAQTMYFENRFIAKYGKTIWLSWTVTRSAEEGVMFCVGKNISDKKEMENLLLKANQLARIGSWEVDREKGTAYWSPITREIYGVTNDFIPSIDNWLSFYREGRDRDYIAGKMAQTIATGEPCDVEVELITPQGNTRWVRAIAEAEFRNGVCVKVYGSFQDIDKQKKAELLASNALEERDAILESIGDGFFAVDSNWVVTYWNTTAERTLNTPRGMVLGKNLWNVFGDALDLDFYKQYQHAMQMRQAVHFEEYYPRLEKWFCVNVYPSAIGLSVFFEDITESKKSAEALVESEKRYSDLFHLSPLPMFVYDMNDLRYLDVNLAAIDHYGYSREEFLAMTILDIRPAEDIPLIKRIIAEQQQNQQAKIQGVVRHCKKNGEIMQVDIQSTIINFRGVKAKVVLANDITERVSYIKAIEIQNEKLKEISWMQSHVIRAPLSRIMGLLPMLSVPQEDTEQQQIFDYLIASANELDKVIQSITEVTSIVRLKDK